MRILSVKPMYITEYRWYDTGSIYKTLCNQSFGLLRILGVLLPMFQPQPRSIFTTFGVTAAVKGTLRKMKDLCIAYASASCVQMPGPPRRMVSVTLHRSIWMIISRLRILTGIRFRVRLLRFLDAPALDRCFTCVYYWVLPRWPILSYRGQYCFRDHILDVCHDDMLPVSNPIRTKCSYREKAEWEVERREGQVDAKSTPSVLSRELS